MPYLLYPWGRSPQYPLYRRLDGPQSQSGHSGEEKDSQPSLKVKHLKRNCPACSQSLYRLSYPDSYPTSLGYINIILPSTMWFHPFRFSNQNVMCTENVLNHVEYFEIALSGLKKKKKVKFWSFSLSLSSGWKKKTYNRNSFCYICLS
jgi:hypothetical protein